MHAVVIYDSQFGNTEQVAKAIARGLASHGTVVIQGVTEAPAPDPASIDLLIVGGPTQRHGASPALAAWLDALGRRTLNNVRAAAFDTRYRMSALLSGSAAGKAAGRLRRAGCRLVAAPESFFVERDRPPEGEKRRHGVERLEAGEIERAEAWAIGLVASLR